MSTAGFSNELYDTIASFGLHRGASILDVACGAGYASKPFNDNGFAVIALDSSAQALQAAQETLPRATLVQGNIEKLPFPAERFDVVLCAQRINQLPRPRAVEEMQRVLKRGGVLAIWWKQLMAQEGARELRDQAYADAKLEPPQEGLSGGFREFYGSDALRDQTVRVLPWRVVVPVDRFVEQEDERVRDRLRSLVAARGADAGIELGYAQYLYLAKKR